MHWNLTRRGGTHANWPAAARGWSDEVLEGWGWTPAAMPCESVSHRPCRRMRSISPSAATATTSPGLIVRPELGLVPWSAVCLLGRVYGEIGWLAGVVCRLYLSLYCMARHNIATTKGRMSVS